ncbi:MAG: lipid-A-disaccharide synthase, partial [Thermodesulfobacteriota bacterium]
KKLKIPVLYYISPQIWAWRQGRAAKLKEVVDHLAVILPFEEEFYKKYDIPVTFVGHPLMDDFSPSRNLKRDPDHVDRKLIGMLPGSRHQEVERHLPIMLCAARILINKNPDIQFLVSVAHTVEQKRVRTIIEKYGKEIPLTLADKGVKSVFENVDMVLATSGTVTLEAAIHGIPELILYRVSPVSYWFGKMLIKVNHIGLANLIAEKEIIPEFIQKQATPDRIAEACDALLKDPKRLERMKKDFESVRNKLGGPGASNRTADIAVRLMGMKETGRDQKQENRNLENGRIRR